MSVSPRESQEQSPEQQNEDKDHNFNLIRKKLEKETAAREAAEQRALKAEQAAQERLKASIEDDDEDDEDPYIDKRRLQKKFSRFEQEIEKKIEAKAEEKARRIMEKEKQIQWMRNNSDYDQVMSHAQKFAEMDPELAETILEMPEGFERQKLVYRNIKALGLHLSSKKEPSIQEKIDSNRKSPYYQPSGVSSPPFASSGDYSPTGIKSAYDKMQELKGRMRL